MRSVCRHNAFTSRPAPAASVLRLSATVILKPWLHVKLKKNSLAFVAWNAHDKKLQRVTVARLLQRKIILHVIDLKQK